MFMYVELLDFFEFMTRSFSLAQLGRETGQKELNVISNSKNNELTGMNFCSEQRGRFTLIRSNSFRLLWYFIKPFILFSSVLIKL